MDFQNLGDKDCTTLQEAIFKEHLEPSRRADSEALQPELTPAGLKTGGLAPRFTAAALIEKLREELVCLQRCNRPAFAAQVAYTFATWCWPMHTMPRVALMQHRRTALACA